MTGDRIEEAMFKFTESISELNANMKTALEKIASHEVRLTNLETNRSSIKDVAIEWLIKGLVAAVVVIGSLTGAGAILSKLFVS